MNVCQKDIFLFFFFCCFREFRHSQIVYCFIASLQSPTDRVSLSSSLVLQERVLSLRPVNIVISFINGRLFSVNSISAADWAEQQGGDRGSINTHTHTHTHTHETPWCLMYAAVCESPSQTPWCFCVSLSPITSV